MKKVSISGYGAVGKALHKLFPEAEIYDPPLGYKNKSPVNKASFNFICVPTPAKKDKSCDTSIVEDIISWSKADINIIKSTIPVGFTTYLIKKYKKNILFSPEYGPSDFVGHPFNELSNIHWLILGGDIDQAKKVAELWRGALYKCKVFYTTPEIAETVKLSENAYLYTKVIFFNQIYDLCEKVGVNYDEMRLLLTEDPRINEDHTYIYPSRRKIGGHCLPKDMSSLISIFKKNKVKQKLFTVLEEINEDLNSL